MRCDSELAAQDFITPADLRNAPLIRSHHSLGKTPVSDWFRTDESALNIVATYNLIYNASLMVEAGLGYAISVWTS